MKKVLLKYFFAILLVTTHCFFLHSQVNVTNTLSFKGQVIDHFQDTFIVNGSIFLFDNSYDIIPFNENEAIYETSTSTNGKFEVTVVQDKWIKHYGLLIRKEGMQDRFIKEFALPNSYDNNLKIDLFPLNTTNAQNAVLEKIIARDNKKFNTEINEEKVLPPLKYFMKSLAPIIPSITSFLVAIVFILYRVFLAHRYVWVLADIEDNGVERGSKEIRFVTGEGEQIAIPFDRPYFNHKRRLKILYDEDNPSSYFIDEPLVKYLPIVFAILMGIALFKLQFIFR